MVQWADGDPGRWITHVSRELHAKNSQQLQANSATMREGIEFVSGGDRADRAEDSADQAPSVRSVLDIETNAVKRLERSHFN